MARLSGTAEERAAAKAQLRRANEVQYIRGLANRATTGRAKVKAATLAALAVNKRITDSAAERMAIELAQVVERFDTAEFWEAQ